jgi:outer membrane protein, heavy metal efflux system
MKIPVILIALAVMVSGVTSAEGQGPDAQPFESLTALIQEARAHNPELRSAAARKRMFASRVKQAGSLEDPMLMFKIQNGLVREPFAFDQDTASAKVVGISQAFPYPGKRALREKGAAAEADSYHWLAKERENELVRMVKETYFQLYATDRSLQVVEKNVRLMAEIIVLARTRYEVGQGAQQDVFKAEVERSKMLEMRINLQQQRKSLAANLNGLLNRATATPVGPLPDRTIQPLMISPEQLSGLAFEHRPQLQAQRSLAQKSWVNRQLADKEYYPDFTVAFEYMQRDAVRTEMTSDPGYNMYSLGVTFNLPLQRERREAMRAESSAETAMAAAEIDALTTAIDAGITALVAQLDRLRETVALYRTGIIPQAEQALEAATISYRVGKTDFLNLLESRNALFAFERQLYEMESDYQMKMAQLEVIVGTELN